MSARIWVAAALCVACWTTGAEAACTAVADAATGKLLKQEGVCDRRFSPASTFKIAISLMGYDSGFLVDEHSPALPFREGYPDWMPSWKTTTDPTAWIKNSVVWYSQQVTKSLGEARFRRYAAAFHYGNEDVSGDPEKHNGLERAWLSSSLKISPLEQLGFLEKIVTRRLPVTVHAYDMTGRITAMGVHDGWDLHGKTGTEAPFRADGSQDWDHAFGWFVGWATKGDRTVVFVRQIEDETKQTVGAGIRAHDSFLAALPSILESPGYADQR
jgi:beta-lactamase class D